MADFINTVDRIGDEALIDSIINRTITELRDNIITKIGTRAFYTHTNLVTLELPNLQTIGSNAFEGCTALTEIVLPKLTAPGMYGFKSCTNLVKADIAATTLQTDCFRGCSKLTTLILRSPTVCTLGAVTWLTATPFSSGGSGGTVYVPAALVESYQTATNWATLYEGGTCTFKAIEGSEYE